MTYMRYMESKKCEIQTVHFYAENSSGFQRRNLEKQIKISEKSLDEDDNLSKCNAISNELDATYDHITNDIRIRSKWDWYEHTKSQQKSL